MPIQTDALGFVPGSFLKLLLKTLSIAHKKHLSEFLLSAQACEISTL